MEVDRSVPKSALVIFAHPDDPEFSVAGTVAAWTAAGCRVTYVLLTSGDVGTTDASQNRAQVIALRETEQRAACAAVGVTDVRFLRYGDGQLEPSLEVRKRLVGIVRELRPEVVLCGDPTMLYAGDEYINHPDHRAAGQAAIDAVAPASSMPLLWPEEGAPHRVRALYISSAREPNVAVDISATIERKVAALRAHASQITGWDPEPRLREWAAENGREVGVAYAERYRRVVINPPGEEEAKPENAELAERDGASGGE